MLLSCLSQRSENLTISDPATTFDALVRPHFDRLYRLAWRLCGAKAEAEDLFQDVLVKAYGKLDQLVTLDEPGPWLARVMYNHFVDDRRRFTRRRLITAEESELAGDGLEGLPGPGDTEAEHARYERLRLLDQALQQLSDEHRLVLMLHDTEGYKLAEIQALTGTPVGTIKSRLHRARARLREILESQGTFF